MPMPRTTVVRIVAGTAIVIAALGGTAACGTGSTSSPSSSASAVVNGHNTQDETFLADMIAHHQQAIDMAEMVPSHTTNPKVIALAKQINAAQGPEIAKMQGWLTEWTEGQTSASPHSSMPGMDGDMPGMDHAGPTGAPTPMGPGMMTAEQMAQLESKSGAAFDKMWLTMMIAHHQGAVTMAQQELAQGENAQVKAVAQGIINGQTKEITQMKAMLAS